MIELEDESIKPVWLEQRKRKDNKSFLRSWIENPLMTGAIAPSGKALARTMASYVDLNTQAPVIELGPGTGPVTTALIQWGVQEERLILVEYCADFCQILKEKFPKATIIQGDAYNLQKTLSVSLTQSACATVSSLPLMTKPVDVRKALLQEAHALMLPEAPFIQFTYALVPPIPKQVTKCQVTHSPRIWKNIPPARVWVYRTNLASQALAA